MSDTTQGSIRDTLAAAFDQQEKPEAAPQTPVEPPQGTPAQQPQTTGRERDESGRFAAKKEAPTETKPPEEKPAQAEQKQEVQTQGAEAAPVEKAPQSWTPAAREEWAKVPAAIRQQVVKREQEVSRLLNETAGVRKFYQEFEAALAPYKDMLSAPPVQVVGNLLQTAAVLHRGSASDKAALVATIMKGYGVSPDAVADALEGKAQSTQQSQPQYRDPRVDELLRRQQQEEQRAQQATMTEAQGALQAFEATSPEFLEDVRDDMIVLLSTNRAKTYEEAYRKACAMSEEVGKILKQRQEQQRQTAQAATARARNAASSVRNEPAAPSNGAQPTSIRGALEAAFAAHSGR